MFAQSSIKTQAFYENVDDHFHHPLFIGCSGGGGHNAAIAAIRQYMIANKYVIAEKLPKYDPVLHSEKPTNSGARSDIEKGLFFTHKIPYLSSGIQQVLKRTSLPVLPNEKDLKDEIQKINDSNLTASKEKKSRFYIDMLIDVYDAGYESAAIWNVLQKQDNTEELKKLIKLQPYSDKENYATVNKAFLEKLKTALLNNQAYTEVISTQAMSLPALCDAVKEYNEIFLQEYPKAPKIKIHQYMTDLPTKGAIHFFNSISQLTPTQYQQMYLYGVNFNDQILKNFGINKTHFAGVFNINPQNNPMVRPGFRNKKLKTINRSKQKTITVQDNSTKTKKRDISVKPNDKVAAIMLGSQAGNDTAEYAIKFASQGFDKVFVFGGKAPHIKKLLDELLNKSDRKKELANKLILLDNQDDHHMANIMVRSDVAVIRGGGLTVMEQMALPHSPNQIILIHTKKDQDNQLSSGISWEDYNVDELIHYLAQWQIQVMRTTVEEVDNQLALIKINVRLPESISALRLIRDHFALLALNHPDLYENSIGSFYAIQDAIREKNVTSLLKIINLTMNQFDSFVYADDIYLKFLNQLQLDIGRNGIDNLAVQLDLLDQEAAKLPSYEDIDNNNIKVDDNIVLSPINSKDLLINQIEKLCDELQNEFKFKLNMGGIMKFNSGKNDMVYFQATKSIENIMQKKISKTLYNNLQALINNCDNNIYSADTAVEAVNHLLNTAKIANAAYKPISLSTAIKGEVSTNKLEKILDSHQLILSKMFPAQKSLHKKMSP